MIEGAFIDDPDKGALSRPTDCTSLCTLYGYPFPVCSTLSSATYVVLYSICMRLVLMSVFAITWLNTSWHTPHRLHKDLGIRKILFVRFFWGKSFDVFCQREYYYGYSYHRLWTHRPPGKPRPFHRALGPYLDSKNWFSISFRVNSPLVLESDSSLLQLSESKRSGEFALKLTENQFFEWNFSRRVNIVSSGLVVISASAWYPFLLLNIPTLEQNNECIILIQK